MLEPPFVRAYTVHRSVQISLTNTGQVSALILPFSSLQRLVVLLTSRYPRFMLALKAIHSS